MTKVYLLLRNNKQSGPHSIDELKALGLKSSDLIWVEGKSFGWSYPSEIDTLKPYLPQAVVTPAEAGTVQQAVPVNHSPSIDEPYLPSVTKDNSASEPLAKPKVYVSLPSNAPLPAEPTVKKQVTAIVESSSPEQVDTIEQKAEALRKKMQAYVPEQKQAVDREPAIPATKPIVPSTTARQQKKDEEPLVTKYASTLNEREEAYTSWIYNNSKTGNNKTIGELQKNWGSIVIAALLILVVGYGISQYRGDKKDPEVATATTEVTTGEKLIADDKPVADPIITEPDVPATQPLTDTRPADNTVAVREPKELPESPKKIIRNISAPEKKTNAATRKPATETEPGKKVVAKTPVKETPVPVPVITKPELATVVTKKSAEPAVEVPKKKKSLNEKVDAFFSKFTRKIIETPVSETPPPTDNATTNPVAATGERKATHRDDKPVAEKPVTAPASPTNVNLTEYVEISSTKPSENWMLGVHGLKVSLRNKGNETVKTAAVECRYYSEENEVLEKKIVNFNNIPPGKTVTFAAPDHRLADHADFKLLTAK